MGERVGRNSSLPDSWVLELAEDQMDVFQELETERQIRTAAHSVRGAHRQALTTRLQRLGLRVQSLGQQIGQDEGRLAKALIARAKPQAAPQTDDRPMAARLAEIAHEIRTPLTGVAGLAQLLSDTTLTHEQRVLAETINASAKAALGVSQSILDWAKGAADDLEILAEPFDLDALIHEIALLMLPAARAKGIRLLIDYDPCLPAQFIGDGGRLRQVLTNLVSNAVKFTAQGHVLIRAMGIEAGLGPHHVHITVEDTGIGIAPQDLGRIFDPFHQVGAQTGHGLGLGLSIAKNLVARMQGTIWVDSDLGRGASFGLRLPLPAIEVPALPPPQIRLRRVLVIDEHPLACAILEGQLRALGLSVTLCASADTALEVFHKDQEFDAVFVDQTVVGDGDLGVLAQLRAMPVVLMCDDAAQRRDKMQGLAAVVQRPVRRADLYQYLGQLHSKAMPYRADLGGMDNLPRPMRILVAEDNRTNQLVFQKMVRDLAVEVAFANTGGQAVHLVQSFKPDLIFMDIAMPEMDGCQATLAIRQGEASGTRLPIIALTAHAEGAELAPLLAAGIDRRMSKPLQKAVLRDVMMEFCPQGARVLPPEGELPQETA